MNNGNAQRTRFVTPFCLSKVSIENVKALGGPVSFRRAGGGRKAVVIHELTLKLDIKTKVGGSFSSNLDGTLRAAFRLPRLPAYEDTGAYYS